MIKCKIQCVYIEVKTPKMMLDCVRTYFKKHTIAFQNGDIVFVQNFMAYHTWQRTYFSRNRITKLQFSIDKRFLLLLNNIVGSGK